MNITQRIATIVAKPGVSAARQDGGAIDLGGGQKRVTIMWTVTTGDVSRAEAGNLLVTDHEGQAESATWLGGVPSILETAQGFITGRTVPFTRAQVIAFANTQWRAQGGNYTNAPDILGMEVDNLDPNSVRVSGLFWVDGGTRSESGYVIRLVDANGATSGANVKFERIT